MHLTVSEVRQLINSQIHNEYDLEKLILLYVQDQINITVLIDYCSLFDDACDLLAFFLNSTWRSDFLNKKVIETPPEYVENKTFNTHWYRQNTLIWKKDTLHKAQQSTMSFRGVSMDPIVEHLRLDKHSLRVQHDKDILLTDDVSLYRHAWHRTSTRMKKKIIIEIIPYAILYQELLEELPLHGFHIEFNNELFHVALTNTLPPPRYTFTN